MKKRNCKVPKKEVLEAIAKRNARTINNPDFHDDYGDLLEVNCRDDLELLVTLCYAIHDYNKNAIVNVKGVSRARLQ